LQIKEVIDAIAVHPEAEPHFDRKRRMPNPREISRYCSSLVIIVSTKDARDKNNEDVELRLAHFSVKEYLTSSRVHEDFTQEFKETAAKASIATVCVAYLLHLDQEIPVREIPKALPFAMYCARHWICHAAVSEEEDGILHKLIMEFFLVRKRSFTTWYYLYNPDRPWDDDMDERRTEPASALYYASLGGLMNQVEALIAHNVNVNAQGGGYGNALQAASSGGHEKIVQMLLDKGADVNAQGGICGNALQAASSGGHEKIVQMLLDKGADVNAQGGDYGNALQAASFGGHEKIVWVLLDKGADVNAQGGHYGNALQAAQNRSYGNAL
jgi:hypothetical protein